jgi:hypothetical protein
MALTITEKNHWKERIAQRIDKRIDQIKCANPKVFQDITDKAKQEAINSVNLTKQFARIAEIETTTSALRNEKDSLVEAAYRTLFGKDSFRSYSTQSDVDSRIKELQRHIEEELLSSHPLGREVAGLQNEKENLLDTVWLATSAREVTTLWEKALKLLGDQATDFQREILSERKPAEG